MSRVSDRPSRNTIPFDSEKLARESEAAEADGDDPLAGLELAEPPPAHPNVIPQPPRQASGTTPPATRARTVTAHDPFTTSLLAEVARRAQTIETAPMRLEDLDDVNATDAADRDRDDLTPTTTPGFRRDA